VTIVQTRLRSTHCCRRKSSGHKVWGKPCVRH
jgi:hypothetical protein